MKTTVIIPTFNRVATLTNAIQSLLIQKDDIDLDILVVDDGSTDETPALLAELSQNHKELRVVRQDNAGVTTARNTGLVHLHPETEFISFLDSDDLSPMGRFSADMPHFSADPMIEITYGRMLMVDTLDYQHLRPAKSAKSVDIVGIQLSCAIFRRSLIKRIGWFDVEFHMGEDVDFLLRVFEANTKFLQTNTQCLYYLRHPDNMTKNIMETRRYFVMAIRKSILRRKADPSIQLNKPEFEIQALRHVEF